MDIGSASPVAASSRHGRAQLDVNAEAIVRSERDGFRMGHELRLNTHLEYVLLPRKYEVPGGELCLILETRFLHRGTGLLDGNVSIKQYGVNENCYMAESDSG